MATTPEEEELSGWGREDWGHVFLHLPFDADAFLGEFEESWDAVIEGLHRWCADFHDRLEPFRQTHRSVFGYLGLLLVTLASLRHSYVRRYARGQEPDQDGTHDCEALCVPMLREPAVRVAIRSLYAPDVPLSDNDVPTSDAATQAEWERVDFDSLRFHRHGTTSFILVGHPEIVVQGQRKPLALKCILYPYLRVPAIVRSTRGYRNLFGVSDVEMGHLAHVWASSARWVMMDFVPGETLAEFLRRQPDSRDIRLELLSDLGRKLFLALATLERRGLHHCDLSPSNIIIRRDAETNEKRFVLVDLGVNYLYSHTVPGSDGPDAAYIAPEVRSSGQQSIHADIYSVGQLLVTIANGPRRRGDAAPVPDGFYTETPLLARFAEDLTDTAPEHRLLIFRPDPERALYPQLQEFFEEELAAMAATRAGRPRRLLSLLTPLAGTPRRQLEMWRIRRDQSLYRDQRRSMHVRWLLSWSLVSATAWYVAASIVIMWCLRDLNWDWGNQWITVLQRTNAAGENEFPFLDTLRADNYPIPDLAGNLPARMVGMSFLLAGARNYQNVLAGLTPLVTGLRQGWLSVLAILAEVHMRLMSVVAFVLVLLTTLIQRDWWPICTAIGIMCVFLCNVSCLAFARVAVRRAREAELSTVPAGRVSGLEAFSKWTPTAGFYSVACWSIGSLIFFGLVKDVYVYAASVASINIVLFYVIKCSGGEAEEVRTGLARACLGAERLRYLSEAPGPPAPGPSA
jgi:serine/threonine protein kinase